MEKYMRIGLSLLLAVVIGIASVAPVAAREAGNEFETLEEMLAFFGGDTEMLLEAFDIDTLVAHFGATKVSEVLGIPVEDPVLDDPKVPFVLDTRYDFKDDKVIVTIKKTYSGLDKTYSQEDFPGVDIAEIEYLTSLKDPNKDYPMLNLANYRQILELTLSNPGKENVLAAIAELEKNPIVRNVVVSYVGMIELSVVIPYGDVSNDGTLSAEDALMVLQHATGRMTLSEKMLFKAGVEELVTAEDALYILQISTGKVIPPDNPNWGYRNPNEILPDYEDVAD